VVTAIELPGDIDGGKVPGGLPGGSSEVDPNGCGNYATIGDAGRKLHMFLEATKSLQASTGALVVEDPSGEGGQRQVLSGEIHHLRLDVLERHLLNSVQVFATKIQIAREQPVRTNVRSLTAHRSK
jgi:hypothetical protein